MIYMLELWTIRALANSALVNSDPKKFGPTQFGPRPLVNSDPDHWSIRTHFIGRLGPQKIKLFGQFGPLLLVSSDLSIGQFGPFPLLISNLSSMYFPQRKLRSD